MRIDAIDHGVPTLADITAICAFYAGTLGMEAVTFACGLRDPDLNLLEGANDA